jgi:hypothetical protein
MNHGVGACLLIDCMDRIASADGRSASARITNVEKAKNTPPATPALTAATSVSARE